MFQSYVREGAAKAAPPFLSAKTVMVDPFRGKLRGRTGRENCCRRGENGRSPRISRRYADHVRSVRVYRFRPREGFHLSFHFFFTLPAGKLISGGFHGATTGIDPFRDYRRGGAESDLSASDNRGLCGRKSATKKMDPEILEICRWNLHKFPYTRYT